MADHPVRVVLVDDHPLFRDGVRRSLEGLGGFEVVAEAGEGAPAVQLALSHRPDILLLDVALPDISGLEVLRRLRDAQSAVPVLLLTAAIDRPQTLEALHLGARGVVMKEAAADLLVRAMGVVLQGDYWVGHRTMADWHDYERDHATPRLTLTLRERQVIPYILEGHTNHDIAQKLRLGEETIKTHVSNIYRKLGVSSRMELALYVASGKLIQPT